jgi:hypothetical protein
MMASCLTFEKVDRTHRDCLKHKRSKPAALKFSVNAEEHLLQLTRELSYAFRNGGQDHPLRRATSPPD